MTIKEIRVYSEGIPKEHMLITYAGEGTPIGIVRAPLALEHIQESIRNRIVKEYLTQCSVKNTLTKDVEIYDAGRIRE